MYPCANWCLMWFQRTHGVLLTRSRSRWYTCVGDTVPQSVGLRSPGPARKGNLPHRGGTQDGVVFQRVLVPLKQVGSSRAARICPKAFASCPRLVQRARLKKGPACVSPCVLCWSPRLFGFLVVLASPAIPVPMRPHIIIKIKVVFDVPATQPPKPLWEGGRCFSCALHTSKAIELGKNEK